RAILARYRELRPNQGNPRIVINSLDVNKGIAMLDAGRLDDLANYLAAGLRSLERAGADFAFMAANTPHLVFDELQGRSKIPLLSIVRAATEHASSLGVKKLGLFGTGFTMRADFYSEGFGRAGIAMVRPKQAEQEFIHSKYIGELLNNQFLPETRTEIMRIARRMHEEDAVEALVLAGTELPLLLRDGGNQDLPFLDTTLIHVEAIVKELVD
ncbi:MAG TPA: amino acid racemase, partial [Candidatus Angelobacter sp.]|nr:amino acid racemase [Candidatus Angelobacter sp.]